LATAWLSLLIDPFARGRIRMPRWWRSFAVVAALLFGANVEVLPRIASICEDMGLTLPIICTPEELLGVGNDQ
jgi:hypothetical protein